MVDLWLKLDITFNIFDNNLPWFRTDLYNGVINFGCIRYESNQIIFEEKVKSGNFNKYITQYSGQPDDSVAATQYIKTDIFEKAFNTYAAGKVFYCHVTTATDTSNADRLFSYIYDMVFEKLIADFQID